MGNDTQIVSRLTWESLQTSIGLMLSDVKLLFHDIEAIEYYDGATYVINKNNKKGNGMTLGSYININDKDDLPYTPKGRFVPFTDDLYMHEYGHYKQSQEYGLGYMFSVGIPSFWDLALKEGKENTIINKISYQNHDLKWFEIHANIKAEKHFDGLYSSWNHQINPLVYP